MSNSGVAGNVCIASRGNRQKLLIFHMNFKFKCNKRQSRFKFQPLKWETNHN